jgi:hypothetical protein
MNCRSSSKFPSRSAITLTKAFPRCCEGRRPGRIQEKAAVKVNDRETTPAGENEIFAVLAVTNA